MLTQRWRLRRSLYRPANEVINIREYEVIAIPGDRDAKAFVEQHHYSQSYPAARFRFGLYHHDQLVGVAIFSHPCNDSVLTKVFPWPAVMATELGRFVLLDRVPADGESFFLGRCFHLLRHEELVGVVAFSDPVPRRTIEGGVVHPGHIGTIYQALNGSYLGRGTPRTLRLLPDGSVLSERAIQKIRRHERGFAYACAILERWGATPFSGDAESWLREWLPRLTRTLHHPGNHKYAWGLHKTAIKMLPKSLPYARSKTNDEYAIPPPPSGALTGRQTRARSGSHRLSRSRQTRTEGTARTRDPLEHDRPEPALFLSLRNQS
jgi:hypothetical protein